MALKSILLCEVGLRFAMASVFYVFFLRKTCACQKKAVPLQPRSASWSCTANDIKEGNYIRVDTTTGTTRVIIYINNSNNFFQQHSKAPQKSRFFGDPAGPTPRAARRNQYIVSTSIYKSLKKVLKI